MPRTGEHLYRREGTFYLRLAVPAGLRELFGTGELRRSLGTGNKRRARTAAHRLIPRLQHLFAELEALPMSSKPTPQQIRRIVDGLFRQIWEASELQLAASPATDIQAWHDLGLRLNQTKGGMQLALALNNHELVKDQAERVAEKFHLDAPAGSPEFAYLARELLRMAVRYYEACDARRQGDIVRERELAPQLNLPAAVEEEPSAQELTLAQLIEQYASERMRGGAWTPRTEQDVRSALGHLVFILGPDARIRDLNKARLREFKELFLQMPTNRSKQTKYQGKTAQQILAMAPAKTISARTINNVLIQASALCAFAVDQGLMQDNPVSGLLLKTEKRPDEERDALTLEDLKLLFGQDGYVQDSFDHPWQFWLPLLGLFTGARLEELAQLHLDDIRQEHGIWVLDICPGQGKTLKNRQSRRLIPLHDVLLKTVNFLAYAERLREEGATRLFPDLTKKNERDRFGKSASQFFSRMFGRLGLHGKKSYHSLRHSFVSRAKELGIDPVALMEIDGHKLPGQTLGRYGKRLSPKILKERVLDRLVFAGLSLKHLGASKYAR